MFHALVRNGKLISQAGAATAVPWWSFGKTVIATAALVLVRDKLLPLDQPVDRQPFTLRQLLRHEAGLADYGPLPEYHAAVERGDRPWADDEMLARTDAERLRYLPGDDWAYSNIGYLHVRRLIERTADEELNAVLQRLVLRPLGIRHARLATSQEDLDGVEMGTAHAYDPRWVFHGLLVGPLQEAALLLDRIMSGPLLPQHLSDAMLDCRSVGGPVAGRPWLSPGYGLGVMAGGVDTGMSVVGHTGGGPGSVIAVYRNAAAPTPLCCATFSAGNDAGKVEREAMQRLE